MGRAVDLFTTSERMHEHPARKRFGQHFLIDPTVIDRLIAGLGLRADDRVVEIGPGLGALTGPLLRRLDHLQVIEIDRDLVGRLRQTYPAERLTIHAADALNVDFSTLAAPAGGDQLPSTPVDNGRLPNSPANNGRLPNGSSRLRVLGNLPYNISTPLLFHLARFADVVADMHFMLQKEVVDRMVAAPGSHAYGRLSVMLQYRFIIDGLFDVPPSAFKPPPKVHSAIVRLQPRPAADCPADDERRLATLVAAAFAQRRKMLRNSLHELIDPARLAELAIAPTARAEELSLADYLRLARLLK